VLVTDASEEQRAEIAGRCHVCVCVCVCVCLCVYYVGVICYRRAPHAYIL